MFDVLGQRTTKCCLSCFDEPEDIVSSFSLLICFCVQDWLQNFQQLLELNTKANWVPYITQRASDMEKLDIKREKWVDNFDDKISMIEGNLET